MNWGKLFRRSAALFLATITLWLLTLTASPGAAADHFRTLGTSAAFVESMLSTQLGWANPSPSLTLWQSLIIGQSPYLKAAQKHTDTTVIQPPAPTPTNTAAGQPEDDTPLPATTTTPPRIIAQTLVPNQREGYLSVGDAVVYNRTKKQLDVAAVSAMPAALTGTGDGPQVLLVHTHATESYQQTDTSQYAESDSSRTTDNNFNMVRVGEALAATLEESGLSVLHDTTLHDYPQYNGAYTRSYQTVANYLAQYPSISLVIDLHRDALIASDGTVYKPMSDATVGKAAQMMLVVGTDERGGTHPNWTQNLSLALHIQQGVTSQYPTLVRPITVRSSHYNQQLSPGSLLLEVGSHGNTLEEAILGITLFGKAAAPVILASLPQG